MSFDTSPRSLDALAWRIAEHGVSAHLAEVREFARAARASGVSEAVVAAVLDPDAPEVARQRAFGMAAAALAAKRSPQGAPAFVVAA
jgi:hypothetical protein